MYCKCFVISKVWKFAFFRLKLIFLFTKCQKLKKVMNIPKLYKSYTEEAVKEAIQKYNNMYFSW